MLSARPLCYSSYCCHTVSLKIRRVTLKKFLICCVLIIVMTSKKLNIGESSESNLMKFIEYVTIVGSVFFILLILSHTI